MVMSKQDTREPEATIAYQDTEYIEDEQSDALDTVEPDSPIRNPQSAFRNFLTGPYPTLISRLVLGSIFLIFGMTKLGVTEGFAQTINDYSMPVTDPVVQIMAFVLPPLEIGLGIWLLVGLFTRFSATI